MAVSLKHAFTSAVADGGDTSLVQPSNWNAEHDLTLGTGKLLGRTTAGTGSAEEISAGTGLSLSAGTLAVSATTPQTNASNTFTSNQIIEVTDNTNAALRVTQLGTGAAIRVEDSASPDATPFIVDATGNVGIGTATPSGKLQVSSGYLSVSYNSQGTYPAYNDAYFALGHNFSNGGNEVDLWNSTGSGFIFHKQTGASTQTELFRFGSSGQLGIAGANYGTSGQVLTSGGASAAPSWSTITVMTPYTSGSGNWTIPSSGTFVLVRAWGAGGSGGRGGSSDTRAGGGGGGAYSERLYLKSDLVAAHTTQVPYSVGAGGAAKTTAGNGNTGGNTTFGSGTTLLTAYGGGGGVGNTTAGSGGGGGGVLSAGSTSAGGTMWGGGSTSGAGGTWGGGGGANYNTATSGAYLGGAGGGGAASNSTGAPGTSVLGGDGGAGANSGGTGTAGSAPGGGGGAYGQNTGTSGAGGAGRIEIWVW